MSNVFDMISVSQDSKGQWVLEDYQLVLNRFEYYKEIFTKISKDQNNQVRLDFREDK